MTNMSNLGPDVKPGYFYMFDLGIRWEFEEFSSIAFNGLHFHSGNLPTYTENASPSPDSYCLTLIAYTPSPLLHGTSAVALGLMPKDFKSALDSRSRDAWSKVCDSYSFFSSPC